MATQRSVDTLEQHQHEVCNAFARAAVAMRDAANTAENFSNWFSRVNNLQNVPLPPSFNGSPFNFAFSNYSGLQQQVAALPADQQTSKKRKAADETEGKRKRIPKKPKDANAPRRPPSPYLLFQNEVRKAIQAKHPDIPYTQVLVEISKLWKEMTPDQKAPYQASQAMLKAKYEQEKVDYDTNTLNPAVSKASTSPTAASGVKKSAEVVQSATSEDSSDESSESSSSGDDDEEDEVEEVKPAPEPPRKKSKKEAPKVPTPPPVKVGKKEKSAEGKKKKKTAGT